MYIHALYNVCIVYTYSMHNVHMSIYYICIYVYVCVHIWVYIPGMLALNSQSLHNPAPASQDTGTTGACHHARPMSICIPPHFFHYLQKIYTSMYSQHCWFSRSHFDTFSLTKIPWDWSIANLASDRKHLESILSISLVHQKMITTTNPWNKEEMIIKWLHRLCLYHKNNDVGKRCEQMLLNCVRMFVICQS